MSLKNPKESSFAGDVEPSALAQKKTPMGTKDSDQAILEMSKDDVRLLSFSPASEVLSARGGAGGGEDRRGESHTEAENKRPSLDQQSNSHSNDKENLVLVRETTTTAMRASNGNGRAAAINTAQSSSNSSKLLVDTYGTSTESNSDNSLLFRQLATNNTTSHLSPPRNGGEVDSNGAEDVCDDEEEMPTLDAEESFLVDHRIPEVVEALTAALERDHVFDNNHMMSIEAYSAIWLRNLRELVSRIVDDKSSSSRNNENDNRGMGIAPQRSGPHLGRDNDIEEDKAPKASPSPTTSPSNSRARGRLLEALNASPLCSAPSPPPSSPSSPTTERSTAKGQTTASANAGKGKVGDEEHLATPFGSRTRLALALDSFLLDLSKISGLELLVSTDQPHADDATSPLSAAHEEDDSVLPSARRPMTKTKSAPHVCCQSPAKDSSRAALEDVSFGIINVTNTKANSNATTADNVIKISSETNSRAIPSFASTVTDALKRGKAPHGTNTVHHAHFATGVVDPPTSAHALTCSLVVQGTEERERMRRGPAAKSGSGLGGLGGGGGATLLPQRATKLLPLPLTASSTTPATCGTTDCPTSSTAISTKESESAPKSSGTNRPLVPLAPASLSLGSPLQDDRTLHHTNATTSPQKATTYSSSATISPLHRVHSVKNVVSAGSWSKRSNNNDDHEDDNDDSGNHTRSNSNSSAINNNSNKTPLLLVGTKPEVTPPKNGYSTTSTVLATASHNNHHRILLPPIPSSTNVNPSPLGELPSTATTTTQPKKSMIIQTKSGEEIESNATTPSEAKPTPKIDGEETEMECNGTGASKEVTSSGGVPFPFAVYHTIGGSDSIASIVVSPSEVVTGHSDLEKSPNPASTSAQPGGGLQCPEQINTTTTSSSSNYHNVVLLSSGESPSFDSDKVSPYPFVSLNPTTITTSSTSPSGGEVQHAVGTTATSSIVASHRQNENILSSNSSLHHGVTHVLSMVVGARMVAEDPEMASLFSSTIGGATAEALTGSIVATSQDKPKADDAGGGGISQRPSFVQQHSEGTVNLPVEQAESQRAHRSPCSTVASSTSPLHRSQRAVEPHAHPSTLLISTPRPYKLTPEREENAALNNNVVDVPRGDNNKSYEGVFAVNPEGFVKHSLSLLANNQQKTKPHDEDDNRRTEQGGAETGVKMIHHAPVVLLGDPLSFVLSEDEDASHEVNALREGQRMTTTKAERSEQKPPIGTAASEAGNRAINAASSGQNHVITVDSFDEAEKGMKVSVSSSCSEGEDGWRSHVKRVESTSVGDLTVSTSIQESRKETPQEREKEVVTVAEVEKSNERNSGAVSAVPHSFTIGIAEAHESLAISSAPFNAQAVARGGSGSILMASNTNPSGPAGGFGGGSAKYYSSGVAAASSPNSGSLFRNHSPTAAGSSSIGRGLSLLGVVSATGGSEPVYAIGSSSSFSAPHQSADITNAIAKGFTSPTQHGPPPLPLALAPNSTNTPPHPLLAKVGGVDQPRSPNLMSPTAPFSLTNITSAVSTTTTNTTTATPNLFSATNSGILSAILPPVDNSEKNAPRHASVGAITAVSVVAPSSAFGPAGHEVVPPLSVAHDPLMGGDASSANNGSSGGRVVSIIAAEMENSTALSNGGEHEGGSTHPHSHPSPRRTKTTKDRNSSTSGHDDPTDEESINIARVETITPSAARLSSPGATSLSLKGKDVPAQISSSVSEGKTTAERTRLEKNSSSSLVGDIKAEPRASLSSATIGSAIGDATAEFTGAESDILSLLAALNSPSDKVHIVEALRTLVRNKAKSGDHPLAPSNKHSKESRSGSNPPLEPGDGGRSGIGGVSLLYHGGHLSPLPLVGNAMSESTNTTASTTPSSRLVSFRHDTDVQPMRSGRGQIHHTQPSGLVVSDGGHTISDNNAGETTTSGADLSDGIPDPPPLDEMSQSLIKRRRRARGGGGPYRNTDIRSLYARGGSASAPRHRAQNQPQHSDNASLSSTPSFHPTTTTQIENTQIRKNSRSGRGGRSSSASLRKNDNDSFPRSQSHEAPEYVSDASPSYCHTSSGVSSHKVTASPAVTVGVDGPNSTHPAVLLMSVSHQETMTVANEKDKTLPLPLEVREKSPHNSKNDRGLEVDEGHTAGNDDDGGRPLALSAFPAITNARASQIQIQIQQQPQTNSSSKVTSHDIGSLKSPATNGHDPTSSRSITNSMSLGAGASSTTASKSRNGVVVPLLNVQRSSPGEASITGPISARGGNARSGQTPPAVADMNHLYAPNIHSSRGGGGNDWNNNARNMARRGAPGGGKANDRGRRRVGVHEIRNVEKAANFVLKEYPKTEEEKEVLMACVNKCTLFTAFDDTEKQKVVSAMFPVEFPAGAEVLTQGLPGRDTFYLIICGRAEVLKDYKVVVALGQGEYFGELELMYHIEACAATIKCITPLVTYALEKETYNNIVLNATLARRRIFLDQIKLVEFFKVLSDYDQMRLAEALSIKKFERDQFLIRCGEQVDFMYMIMSGTVAVIGRSKEDPTKRENIVDLGPGQVVGELEFLFQHAAVADVVAIDGLVSVAKLSRPHFIMIMGDMFTELKSQVAQGNYGHYLEHITDDIRREVDRAEKAQRKRKNRNDRSYSRAADGSSYDGGYDGGGSDGDNDDVPEMHGAFDNDPIDEGELEIEKAGEIVLAIKPILNRNTALITANNSNSRSAMNTNGGQRLGSNASGFLSASVTNLNASSPNFLGLDEPGGTSPYSASNTDALLISSSGSPRVQAQQRVFARFPASVTGGDNLVLIVIQEDGTIIHWNSVIARLTQYKEEDVIGQSIFSFLTNEDQQKKLHENIRTVCKFAGDFEGYVAHQEEEEVGGTLVSLETGRTNAANAASTTFLATTSSTFQATTAGANRRGKRLTVEFAQFSGLYRVHLSIDVAPPLVAQPRHRPEMVLIVGHEIKRKTATASTDYSKWFLGALEPLLRQVQSGVNRLTQQGERQAEALRRQITLLASQASAAKHRSPQVTPGSKPSTPSSQPVTGADKFEGVGAGGPLTGGSSPAGSPSNKSSSQSSQKLPSPSTLASPSPQSSEISSALQLAVRDLQTLATQQASLVKTMTKALRNSNKVIDQFRAVSELKGYEENWHPVNIGIMAGTFLTQLTGDLQSRNNVLDIVIKDSVPTADVFIDAVSLPESILYLIRNCNRNIENSTIELVFEAVPSECVFSAHSNGPYVAALMQASSGGGGGGGTAVATGSDFGSPTSQWGLTIGATSNAYGPASDATTRGFHHPALSSPPANSDVMSVKRVPSGLTDVAHSSALKTNANIEQMGSNQSPPPSASSRLYPVAAAGAAGVGLRTLRFGMGGNLPSALPAEELQGQQGLISVASPSSFSSSTNALSGGLPGGILVTGPTFIAPNGIGGLGIAAGSPVSAIRAHNNSSISAPQRSPPAVSSGALSTSSGAMKPSSNVSSPKNKNNTSTSLAEDSSGWAMASSLNCDHSGVGSKIDKNSLGNASTSPVTKIASVLANANADEPLLSFHGIGTLNGSPVSQVNAVTTSTGVSSRAQQNTGDQTSPTGASQPAPQSVMQHPTLMYNNTAGPHRPYTSTGPRNSMSVTGPAAPLHETGIYQSLNNTMHFGHAGGVGPRRFVVEEVGGKTSRTTSTPQRTGSPAANSPAPQGGQDTSQQPVLQRISSQNSGHFFNKSRSPGNQPALQGSTSANPFASPGQGSASPAYVAGRVDDRRDSNLMRANSTHSDSFSGQIASCSNMHQSPLSSLFARERQPPTMRTVQAVGAMVGLHPALALQSGVAQGESPPRTTTPNNTNFSTAFSAVSMPHLVGLSPNSGIGGGIALTTNPSNTGASGKTAGLGNAYPPHPQLLSQQQPHFAYPSQLASPFGGVAPMGSDMAPQVNGIRDMRGGGSTPLFASATFGASDAHESSTAGLLAHSSSKGVLHPPSAHGQVYAYATSNASANTARSVSLSAVYNPPTSPGPHQNQLPPSALGSHANLMATTNSNSGAKSQQQQQILQSGTSATVASSTFGSPNDVANRVLQITIRDRGSGINPSIAKKVMKFVNQLRKRGAGKTSPSGSGPVSSLVSPGGGGGSGRAGSESLLTGGLGAGSLNVEDRDSIAASLRVDKGANSILAASGKGGLAVMDTFKGLGLMKVARLVLGMAGVFSVHNVTAQFHRYQQAAAAAALQRNQSMAYALTQQQQTGNKSSSLFPSRVSESVNVRNVSNNQNSNFTSQTTTNNTSTTNLVTATSSGGHFGPNFPATKVRSDSQSSQSKAATPVGTRELHDASFVNPHESKQHNKKGAKSEENLGEDDVLDILMGGGGGGGKGVGGVLSGTFTNNRDMDPMTNGGSAGITSATPTSLVSHSFVHSSEQLSLAGGGVGGRFSVPGTSLHHSRSIAYGAPSLSSPFIPTGTEFVITIPLAISHDDDDEHDNDRKEGEGGDSAGGGGNVRQNFTTILVEKSAVHRNMVCQLLWGRKHAVLPATGWRDVARLAEGGTAEILIVDPESFADTHDDDGVDLLRPNSPFNDQNQDQCLGPIERLSRFAGKLAILMMSNNFVSGGADFMSPVMENGIIFLPKPCPPAILHQAIIQAETLMRQRREEQRRIAKTREAFSKTNHAAIKTIRLLGKGAFGEVHEVEDTITQGRMAMKILQTKTKAIADEVLKEIQAMTTLKHENIIHYIYCEKVDERNLKIFMELASGGTVADKIKDTKGQGLPLETISRYVRDILHGLDYIHKNRWVHCDIKPQNVLLDREGRCKLGDFGTASHLEPDNIVGITALKGTPMYMAPEVIEADEIEQHGFDMKADIWSLGVTVMEMATAQPPFSHIPDTRGHMIMKYISDLKDKGESPNLSPLFSCDPLIFEFVQACLNVDPTARPTASELLSYGMVAEAGPGGVGGGAGKLLWRAQLLHILNQFVAFKDEVVPEVYSSNGNKTRGGVPLIAPKTEESNNKKEGDGNTSSSSDEDEGGEGLPNRRFSDEDAPPGGVNEWGTSSDEDEESSDDADENSTQKKKSEPREPSVSTSQQVDDDVLAQLVSRTGADGFFDDSDEEDDDDEDKKDPPLRRTSLEAQDKESSSLAPIQINIDNATNTPSTVGNISHDLQLPSAGQQPSSSSGARSPYPATAKVVGSESSPNTEALSIGLGRLQEDNFDEKGEKPQASGPSGAGRPNTNLFGSGDSLAQISDVGLLTITSGSAVPSSTRLALGIGGVPPLPTSPRSPHNESDGKDPFPSRTREPSDGHGKEDESVLAEILYPGGGGSGGAHKSKSGKALSPHIGGGAPSSRHLRPGSTSLKSGGGLHPNLPGGGKVRTTRSSRTNNNSVSGNDASGLDYAEVFHRTVSNMRSGDFSAQKRSALSVHPSPSTEPLVLRRRVSDTDGSESELEEDS